MLNTKLLPYVLIAGSAVLVLSVLFMLGNPAKAIENKVIAELGDRA